MSKEETIMPHEAPSFSEFISELVNGDVEEQLTSLLAEVTNAVQETGLVGELKLTLKVKKEGDRALVAVDISKKVPEHPIHGTLFYFGHGSLIRDDPRQMKLKGLEVPRRSFKTVGDEG